MGTSRVIDYIFLYIDGNPVLIELDNGAVVSIISEYEWNQLIYSQLQMT